MREPERMTISYRLAQLEGEYGTNENNETNGVETQNFASLLFVCFVIFVCFVVLLHSVGCGSAALR
jgi:hypothetical protein